MCGNARLDGAAKPAGDSKTPEGTASHPGRATCPVQAPDRLVDASIDRSTLIAQGPFGQDEEYGLGDCFRKRLIHEIRSSWAHSGACVHSLSTIMALITRVHERASRMRSRPWRPGRHSGGGAARPPFRRERGDAAAHMGRGQAAARRGRSRGRRALRNHETRPAREPPGIETSRGTADSFSNPTTTDASTCRGARCKHRASSLGFRGPSGQDEEYGRGHQGR